MPVSVEKTVRLLVVNFSLTVLTNKSPIAGKHSNRSQACRIQVSFQGFEWFMYNRTAAYDDITSAMDLNNRTPQPESRHSEDTNEPHRTTTKSSGFEGVLT